MSGDRPTLARLFSASGTLFRETAAQSAVILAAGLVPGAFLAAAAFVYTGVLTRDALNDMIQDGRWLQALPLFAAGMLKDGLGLLAFAALVLSVDAAEAGRPLSTPQAYAQAARRFGALLAAGLRALLSIAVGMLMLFVPGVRRALNYTYVHLSVLVEGRAGNDALERSAQLVKSAPKRALGYLALATLAAGLLNALFAYLVALATGGAAALGAGEVGVVQGQLESLFTELGQSIVGAWLVGFSILLYRDLAAQAANERA